MCITSEFCPCENREPIEKRIREGFSNLHASPHLDTEEETFEIPESYSDVGQTGSGGRKGEYFGCGQRAGFLSELIQSELALWTFAVSSVLTYVWQSPKRFCLFNVFILLPSAIGATVCLSWMLVVFVSLGRLYYRFYPLSDNDDACDGRNPATDWIIKRLPMSTYGQDKYGGQHSPARPVRHHHNSGIKRPFKHHHRKNPRDMGGNGLCGGGVNGSGGAMQMSPPCCNNSNSSNGYYHNGVEKMAVNNNNNNNNGGGGRGSSGYFWQRRPSIEKKMNTVAMHRHFRG